MAYIYQRGKKGIWWIKYYLNSRQVFQCLHTDQQRVATRIKRQIEGEQAKGDLLAPSQTPLFSYATLLLAAADTWGVDAIEGPLPLPKWRAKSCGRLSTQQMVQELRSEVWAEGLDHLADCAEGFVTIYHDDTKPLALPDNLKSALLYGSAA